jgi:hypothetical protein
MLTAEQAHLVPAVVYELPRRDRGREAGTGKTTAMRAAARAGGPPDGE